MFEFICLCGNTVANQVIKREGTSSSLRDERSRFAVHPLGGSR
jgi:hypothetical protein